MKDQAENLRIAVERRKQYLIGQLFDMDYDQTPDGKELLELTLPELEQIHINEKCRVGRK